MDSGATRVDSGATRVGPQEAGPSLWDRAFTSGGKKSTYWVGFSLQEERNRLNGLVFASGGRAFTSGDWVFTSGPEKTNQVFTSWPEKQVSGESVGRGE